MAIGGLTESSLRSLQHSAVHGLIGVDGHLPWIVSKHNILHPLTGGEHIVRPSDTLTHSQNIKVVAEEVQVDIGLFQRIGRVKLDLTLGQRAQKDRQ